MKHADEIQDLRDMLRIAYQHHDVWVHGLADGTEVERRLATGFYARLWDRIEGRVLNLFDCDQDGLHKYSQPTCRTLLGLLDRLTDDSPKTHRPGVSQRTEYKPGEPGKVLRATITAEVPGGTYAAPPSRGLAVTAEGVEIEVINDGSLSAPLSVGTVILVALAGGKYYPVAGIYSPEEQEQGASE